MECRTDKIKATYGVESVIEPGDLGERRILVHIKICPFSLSPGNMSFISQRRQINMVAVSKLKRAHGLRPLMTRLFANFLHPEFVIQSPGQLKTDT